MNIEALSLQHFRNFRQVQEITFPEKALMVAVAPNATGKTNFLESITVLLRGKSFRSALEECVEWEYDHFIIQGRIRHEGDESAVSVRYHSPTKKLRIEEDGLPVSLVRFYSHYPFVLFLPEDTFLFSRSPALRRNFLNTVLASSPSYLSALVQYQRVVRQRNAALKQAVKPEDIQVWTDLLAQHAAVVWQQRQALADFFQQHLTATYQNLFGTAHNFQLRLVPGTPDVATFRETLMQSWPQEKRFSYTLYGPHRDDIVCTVDGKPVETVFSRGQLRGLVVALKVGVYRFLKQLTGDDPLILLDDILSELDEDRQKTLLEHLPATQILLTSTSVPESFRKRSDVYFLDLRSLLKPAPVKEKAEEHVSTAPQPVS
jgi:DNA replication and repair protein RecF